MSNEVGKFAKPSTVAGPVSASSIVSRGLPIHAPESSTTIVVARREPLPVARIETCYGAGTQERENAQYPDVADLTLRKETPHADTGSAETNE